eukprot:1152659-Pelagomonas_calceolata.AAC.2
MLRSSLMSSLHEERVRQGRDALQHSGGINGGRRNITWRMNNTNGNLTKKAAFMVLKISQATQRGRQAAVEAGSLEEHSSGCDVHPCFLSLPCQREFQVIDGEELVPFPHVQGGLQQQRQSAFENSKGSLCSLWTGISGRGFRLGEKGRSRLPNQEGQSGESITSQGSMLCNRDSGKQCFFPQAPAAAREIMIQARTGALQLSISSAGSPPVYSLAYTLQGASISNVQLADNLHSRLGEVDAVPTTHAHACVMPAPALQVLLLLHAHDCVKPTRAYRRQACPQHCHSHHQRSFPGMCRSYPLPLTSPEVSVRMRFIATHITRGLL